MTDTSSTSTPTEGVTEVAEAAEGPQPAATSADESVVAPEDDRSGDGASGERGGEAGPDRKAAAGTARPAGARAADLFRESEIAADYVEGLLDILDLDGDIDELVVGGRPMVEVIEGSDPPGRRLQSLVGTRGTTLEALQELTRLAVYRKTGSPSRLLLDVGGYRTARRKELTAVAKNAAEKVKEFGEPVRLEAMSAFERKCVHDVINAMAGVQSESEGTEPARRVVVSPTQ
jgi:spoIIIJ-associated protein